MTRVACAVLTRSPSLTDIALRAKRYLQTGVYIPPPVHFLLPFARKKFLSQQNSSLLVLTGAKNEVKTGALDCSADLSQKFGLKRLKGRSVLSGGRDPDYCQTKISPLPGTELSPVNRWYAPFPLVPGSATPNALRCWL